MFEVCSYSLLLTMHENKSSARPQRSGTCGLGSISRLHEYAVNSKTQYVVYIKALTLIPIKGFIIHMYHLRTSTVVLGIQTTIDVYLKALTLVSIFGGAVFPKSAAITVAGNAWLFHTSSTLYYKIAQVRI